MEMADKIDSKKLKEIHVQFISEIDEQASVDIWEKGVPQRDTLAVPQSRMAEQLNNR